MADLLNSVILLIVIMVIVRLVVTSKRQEIARKAARGIQTDYQPNPATAKRQPSGGTKTTGISEGLRGGTRGSAGSKGDGLSVRYTMEDRNHDWLAKQLSEEFYAKKKMKEMFGFKDVHSSHCEARQIRDEHSRDCDAHGVDTATK